MKFCGILRRLGIACHAVGLLMFLLGFMTVNWVDMPYRRGSAGLWQICYNRNLSFPHDANDTTNHTNNFTNKPEALFQLGHRRKAAASLHSSKISSESITQRGSIETMPKSTSSHPTHQELSDHLIGLNPPPKLALNMENGAVSTTEASMALPPVRPRIQRSAIGVARVRRSEENSPLHSTYPTSDEGNAKKAGSLGANSIFENKDVDLVIESDPRESEIRDENGDSDVDYGAEEGSSEDRTDEPLYDDSLPSHIKLDSDGCWKYGVTEVDAYLHMVRALMTITAFCYAYGIANGSTRRARIQPRSTFSRQHRGELLSYTGAFLSYFAVQIYEFGFHTDSLVLQFVTRPKDLKLGWSAQCVRFSALMVAPSVLLLLAPTLRIKLRKLLSDCWAAIGCTGDEGGVYGERRASLFATLTHNFWQDPLGNCFRFITCRRAVIDGELATPDSEMGPVDRSRHPGMSGLSGRNFHPTDPSLLHAPPPPYSFLHPISSDQASSSYRHGLQNPDSVRDEQYFVVSGILSVAIPHRPVGGAEPAPAYQDISPPPTYEEATQGIVRDAADALHPLPASSSTSPTPHTQTVSSLTNPSSIASPHDTPPSSSAIGPDVLTHPASSLSTPTLSSMVETVTVVGTQSASPTATRSSSHLCTTQTPSVMAPAVSTLSTPTPLTPTTSIGSMSPKSTSLFISPSSSTSSPHASLPTSVSSTQSSTSPSSSGLNAVSHNQGTTSESAAVAAAVVSAAVTTSVTSNFTLPALLQFPQPSDQISCHDLESTSLNQKTLEENKDPPKRQSSPK